MRQRCSDALAYRAAFLLELHLFQVLPVHSAHLWQMGHVNNNNNMKMFNHIFHTCPVMYGITVKSCPELMSNGNLRKGTSATRCLTSSNTMCNAKHQWLLYKIGNIINIPVTSLTIHLFRLCGTMGFFRMLTVLFGSCASAFLLR